MSAQERDVRRIHVDTDPGLDDLLALALAAGSPELEVCGLTTVAGNAPIDAVTDNARRFIALAGWNVPLGRGAAGPLALEPHDGTTIHGSDGRGGVALPEVGAAPLPTALEVLESSLIERGVEMVVALGPLTNIAALLRHRPDALERVELVWMGGSLGAGNVTPLAEFNAWCDPLAAHEVLRSGAPMRVIGLDVTGHTRLRPADLPSPPFGEGARGRFLRDVLHALMKAESTVYGEPVAVLHDPCAVLCATDRTLFRYENRSLCCDATEGRSRGQLAASSDAGPAVRFAVEVNATEIERRFVDRLGAWSRSA